MEIVAWTVTGHVHVDSTIAPFAAPALSNCSPHTGFRVKEPLTRRNTRLLRVDLRFVKVVKWCVHS